MADVVIVGYTCPECGNKVAVLSSNDHPKLIPYLIPSECNCGYSRIIALEELQNLEVWRVPERKTA